MFKDTGVQPHLSVGLISVRQVTVHRLRRGAIGPAAACRAAAAAQHWQPEPEPRPECPAAARARRAFWTLERVLSSRSR